MLNGYDNKNDNQQVYLAKITTTTTLHVQVTFCTFLCRCCCNVKLPSWTFYEGNASNVLTHTKKLLLVFLFTFPFFFFFSFFFLLSLIFTLPATSSSHFLTNEIGLLCFSSLAVALCSSFVAYFLVFSAFFYFPNL